MNGLPTFLDRAFLDRGPFSEAIAVLEFEWTGPVWDLTRFQRRLVWVRRGLDSFESRFQVLSLVGELLDTLKSFASIGLQTLQISRQLSAQLGRGFARCRLSVIGGICGIILGQSASNRFAESWNAGGRGYTSHPTSPTLRVIHAYFAEMVCFDVWRFLRFWREDGRDARKREPRMKVSVVCCALALCGVGRASAQDQPKLDWFLGGGASFLDLGTQKGPYATVGPPGSDEKVFLRDHSSTNWHVITGFRYHVTANDAVEASVLYQNHEFRTTGAQTGASLFAIFESYNGSLNYVRFLPNFGRVRPFGTVGIGITASNSAFAVGQHNFAGNFGVGADVRLKGKVGIRFEVRDYITHLAKPLQGSSHDWHPSVGLVVGLGAGERAGTAFPRFEFFVEGGTSSLTGGNSNPQNFTFTMPNGEKRNLTLIQKSSYTTAGRLFFGARVRITEKNAMEISWSYSPNRYALGGTVDLAGATVVPVQVTQWYNSFPVNYVRYLPSWERLHPFVTGGIGVVRFAGITQDIDRFSGNFGAGADVTMNRWSAARFEMRDFIVRQPEPIKGVSHNLAPTAGVVFYFH